MAVDFGRRRDPPDRSETLKLLKALPADTPLFGWDGAKGLVYDGPAEAERFAKAALAALVAATGVPLPRPQTGASAAVGPAARTAVEVAVGSRIDSATAVGYFGSAVATGDFDHDGEWPQICAVHCRRQLRSLPPHCPQAKRTWWSGRTGPGRRVGHRLGRSSAATAMRNPLAALVSEKPAPPCSGTQRMSARRAEVRVVVAAAAGPHRGGGGVPAGGGRRQVLGGSVVHGRFGKALAVGDFDGDGVDDLAVGAPSASFERLNASAPVPDSWVGNGFLEWGKIYIFKGAKATGLGANYSAVIETTDDLTGLGAVLAAADLDGDGVAELLAGCPWSSFTAEAHPVPAVDSINTGGLLSLTAPAPGRLPAGSDARGAARLALTGAGYSWFGQSVAVLPGGLLAVGAPGHRDGSGVTVGAVQVHHSGARRAHSPARFQRGLVLSCPALAVAGTGVLACTVVGAAPLGEFGGPLPPRAAPRAVSSRRRLSTKKDRVGIGLV